jgi:hypothetical protein
LHDNAPAQQTFATLKKLAYLDFQCPDHQPSSLVVGLSDYHLFPRLKKTIERLPFSSDAEVIAATETWFGWTTSRFFFFFFKRLSKVRATG